MIIKSIKISELHGEYDYDVKFDSKLTFLYGTNGSGKTTILNILASIITGKLYNLIEYSFKEISLYYAQEESEKSDVIQIIPILNNNSLNNIKVIFNKGNYYLENIDFFLKNVDDEDIDVEFFRKYPIVESIKKLFNYIYLPLSRYGGDISFSSHNYYRYFSKRTYYTKFQNPYNTYLNESLENIDDLIRRTYTKISINENLINDKFRKAILSSSISLSDKLSINKIFDGIDNSKLSDFDESHKKYIQISKDIGIYDEKFNTKVEKFFQELKQLYENHKNKDGLSFELVLKYTEFLKIQDMAKIAEFFEKQKEENRKSINLFKDIINSFLQFSNSNKSIDISNKNGDINFTVHDRLLKLSNMSSGEKQIIITFASLIFGLSDNSTGIFIVDEPEASLHLGWQAMFIETIFKVKKKVQLIFATHSPELIGKYNKNAVMLNNKYKGNT